MNTSHDTGYIMAYQSRDMIVLSASNSAVSFGNRGSLSYRTTRELPYPDHHEDVSQALPSPQYPPTAEDVGVF